MTSLPAAKVNAARDSAEGASRSHEAAPPRDSLDGSALLALAQMAGAGIGVALIPEMAAAAEPRLR